MLLEIRSLSVCLDSCQCKKPVDLVDLTDTLWKIRISSQNQEWWITGHRKAPRRSPVTLPLPKPAPAVGGKLPTGSFYIPWIGIGTLGAWSVPAARLSWGKLALRVTQKAVWSCAETTISGYLGAVGHAVHVDNPYQLAKWWWGHKAAYTTWSVSHVPHAGTDSFQETDFTTSMAQSSANMTGLPVYWMDT